MNIYGYAVQQGYDKESKLRGLTPWRSIQAQLYMNIKKDNSIFEQVSVHPIQFGLKNHSYVKKQSDEAEKHHSFVERDLHPLVVSYLAGDSHFGGHTKTIYHEKSSKKSKNEEKWMHPDLVSVHYPFEDFNDQTVELSKNTGQSGIGLFSFELKINVDASNVREYFFQAVSNSSWANEGYLVALHFTEDALDQLSRLSASFGIGVICIDSEDVHQSKILIPAKESEFLDLGIVDDLSKINRDYEHFLRAINDSMKTHRVVESDYDAVLDDEELQEYITKYNIG